MAAKPTPMADTLANEFSRVGGNGDGTDAATKELVRATQTAMGRLASPLLTQLGITSEASDAMVMLDSACGSGAMTQEVQRLVPRETLQRSRFVCADSAEGLVRVVNSRIEDEGWVNTEARVLDATVRQISIYFLFHTRDMANFMLQTKNTGLPRKSFSHVVLGLALHLIPNPDDALQGRQRSYPFPLIGCAIQG